MLRLRFRPLLRLGYALRQVFTFRARDARKGDISPFQSLMTSLAATIGTGNIVGVATAMTLGGPGALLWMWVSALFGLATKYSEAVLAVKYRERNAKGEMAGGPMYTLRNGFAGKAAGRVLAALFAVFTVLASFGMGNMAQANSIADALHASFGLSRALVGIVTAVLAGCVLLGGIRSVGRMAAAVVPFMALFYAAGALFVIGTRITYLPAGLRLIVGQAFSLQAAGGGVAGSVMASAMRFGVARGVFSNEAGLGSAPIAAAAAQTDHPCRQGYISMTGTFFDTLVVCTLTGLAIACSGVLGQTDPATGMLLTGAPLTIAAFSSVLGRAGEIVVVIGLVLFAFSTLIGWCYYGEKGLEYLCPSPVLIWIYRAVYIAVVVVGATTPLTLVWAFSDLANGLMAIPNLISLAVLSGVVVRETKGFERRQRRRHSGITREE